MRKPLKITSRSSSITNAFVQSIIPFDPPSEADKAEVLAFFGQTSGEMTCVYCGTSANDWDHLLPLVRNKRPTGFFSGKGNVVPACGRCNQSKSGQDWERWMRGASTNSPKSRGVRDLEERVALLSRYAESYPKSAENLEAIVDPVLWAAYWAKLADLHDSLRAAQKLADEISSQIRGARVQDQR
jgi:hypothetical protein